MARFTEEQHCRYVAAHFIQTEAQWTASAEVDEWIECGDGVLDEERKEALSEYMHLAELIARERAAARAER